MSLEIRACRRDEFRHIAGLLDREFIQGKGRSLSLVERYPHSLSPDNIEQIRVAAEEDRVSGALVIRLFDWITGSQVWRGAMVGMVWVEPRLRGRGIGGSLLESLPAFLGAKPVDYGILWTGHPAFYERFGWLPIDRGIVGEARIPSGPFIRGGGVCQPLTEIDPAWLEDARSRYISSRVLRSPAAYRTIPIPAEHVLCFRDTSGDVSKGYALCGRQGQAGYFYEMAAPPESWEVYWRMALERSGRLLVNGQREDPFCRWLEDKQSVTWALQTKALWLPVSGRADRSLFGSWHVPYFDWI